MTSSDGRSDQKRRPRKLGRGLSGLIPSSIAGKGGSQDAPEVPDRAQARDTPPTEHRDSDEASGDTRIRSATAGSIESTADSRADASIGVELEVEGAPAARVDEGASPTRVGADRQRYRPAGQADSANKELAQTAADGDAGLSDQGRDGDDALADSVPTGEVPRGTESGGGGTPDEGRFELLDVDSIRPNPHQPREHFDSEAIEQLAASIRASGLIQPIIVRRVGTELELVAGERRLKACKLAGLQTIPAIIRTLSDRSTAEWALVENLQREDLNPLERAKGLRRLIDEFGLTHQQAAEAVGLERASVSNILRLLDLDPGTASLVARGTLGQGHAKVLLAVPDLDVRAHLCRTLIAKNWSVRRLEMEVRKLAAPPVAASGSLPTASASKSPSQIESLERQLSEHLGTRVQISLSRRRGQGRLLIDFHSLEHFDDLMERVGFAAGTQ